MSRRSNMALATLLVACAFALGGCVSHHAGAMPGEPTDSTFKAIQGARVHYVDTQTDGPPVVLLHGFASSLNNWAGVMPVLKEDHRVIALDLKGFGWTDRPAGDYSPQAQAKLVWGLLDELGVEGPVAIVAHSWGSSVALAMALQTPDKVRRIALYDAWVYAEQLPSFFLWSRAAALGELLFWMFYKEQPDLKMSNAFYDKTIIDESFVELVDEQLDRPGTIAAALAAVRGQRFELVEHEYRTITAPVLLLWGREDAVTPLRFGERLYSELPNASLEVYPRCGHFPMIEAYGASTRELRDFLALDLGAGEPDVASVKPDITLEAPGDSPEPEEVAR